MEYSNTRPHRPLNAQMVQNFHLLWLDECIDVESDEDCRNSITKLREIVNTIYTFTDVDECLDFITDVRDQYTFMIVSPELSQMIIPVVQDISQVSCVCIFRGNKIQHEEWMQQWSKIKGVYADITSICETLKQFAQDCDHNSVSISFVKTTGGTSAQSLDTLDQSFMYTQILKEILLTIDFDQSHINDFLMYYRAELAENTSALKNLDKIAKEYHHHKPIWWYTYDSLLFSMVNKALRLMDVDLIIKMGFFVRDLHLYIAELHTEQFPNRNNSASFTVYRGQGLPHTVLNQLKETQGGLMSFNNFLSTSLDQAVSLAFAESNQYNSDLIGILFEININPSIPSSAFANIKTASHYEEEEEILFSMHSIFRIGQVKQIGDNARLWEVSLTLTSDTDPQLHDLTEKIREETSPKMKGWYRLGNLLVRLGQFDKAQQVFDIMLENILKHDEKAYIDSMLGMVKTNQGKYTDALMYHKEALEISQKTLPTNHPYLTTSYNNIGEVYRSMGEYSKALSYYEKALEISQNTLPANHPDLTTFYNNIGDVYCNMGEYSKALSYYKTASEILQKTLPTNHPYLATSYNNIGVVYCNMGEYSKTLQYFEKATEISQKTLPANHPNLAASYNNIGAVYNNMGEYSKTLQYYEKASEILQKTLPTNHPYLATTYNNIGAMYCNMGEYSKTLQYFEKATEILQKTLPANHPYLAASYNNIGAVYNNMGEYSKALSHYEKALEIYQKTLPANHPDLAVSYNNIGAVYDNMEEYSKALQYYEKALEIRQKTLPANHPDLAVSYNSIGVVYCNMGEYSKALPYYEHALEIFQRSLPSKHPHLEVVKRHIDIVKKKL